MVSTAGGVFIAIFVILIVAAVGWVVFTQMRARRLGLPPPSFSSYIPFLKRDEASFGSSTPQPASGGVMGFFNDQVRKFRNRNNRTAAGAYEESANPPAERRGFGQLDPDDAWDARVGHDNDGYGYYEEQELGYRGAGSASGGGGGGEAYNMNIAATPAHERGRSPGEQGGGGGLRPQKNPFDDDAAVDGSLRGVSPRPMETGSGQGQDRQQGREDDDGHAERRSMFRENM